jgi:NADH:ubiquinone oxidoreductase subunit 3 (subunit A)
MFSVNYLSLFVFFSLSVLLSSIIFGLSYLVSMKANDVEKLSAYECGFNPFDDSRGEFDIRFYIVAILFLVFDLEISFLFPFVTTVFDTDDLAFYSMLFFLFVLTVGFLYE